LATRITGIAGSTSPVTYHPRPTDDPMQRRPDITKAEHHLDWRPSIPLAAGLERTVEYFRDFVE
jgi:UDP-glucuronate decarboxylase